MFDFETKPKQPSVLEATTFNFDTSDFTSLVTESDSSLYGAMNSYRALMTQTLTESAGVINEDANLIMEQANEHIGQKILKVLVAIKNWLIKTAKSIILKIQTLVTSNKKLLDKIKPAVQKKSEDGTLASLKAELYDYDLSVVTVENILGKWNDLYLSSDYDLRPDYTEENKEKLDAAAKKVGEAGRDEIVTRALRSMYKGHANSTKDVAMEARKLLRKGGERKVTSFTMNFFDIAENFDKVKDPIKKTFDGLVEQVDAMIKEITTGVKETKKGEGEKAFISGKVAYYNAKRKILTISLDTAVFLNNLKLQAAVEQAAEAKKFCVQAYHYKAVKEDASEPYVPYLDIDGDNDNDELDNEDIDESMLESAKW
jgi:hypothetical protein